MSRLTARFPISSTEPETALSVCERCWVYFAGRPRYLIRDSGPGAAPQLWHDYCSVWDISIILNQANTPSQMGLEERAVGIAKEGARRVLPTDRTLSDEQALRYACAEKNNMPMLNSNIAPAMAMFGKSNMPGPFEPGSIRQETRRTRENTTSKASNYDGGKKRTSSIRHRTPNSSMFESQYPTPLRGGR